MLTYLIVSGDGEYKTKHKKATQKARADEVADYQRCGKFNLHAFVILF